MNKNNPSRRRFFQNKKALLIAGALLVLVGMLAAIWLPTRNDPELLSLSKIAVDITG
jgi:hypothetical protein